MKYVFHPAALTEYAETVQFYAERRVELAQALIDAVEDVNLPNCQVSYSLARN